MMRSMFSGVSGLRIHQTKMDVIANNISNVNTVGYKSARVTFNEVFSQTVSGAAGANTATNRGGTNPMQIGLGAGLASIDKIMTQGAAQRTDNPFDLLIQGDGFFIVGDNSGAYFTRAGNFTIDNQGNLVTASGMKVMGWDTAIVNGAYAIQKDRVSPIMITGDKEYSTPNSTYVSAIAGNLNYQDMTYDSVTGTYSKTTSVSFYDSLGTRYVANVQFTYDPISAVWSATVLTTGGNDAFVNGDTANGVNLGLTFAGDSAFAFGTDGITKAGLGGPLTSLTLAIGAPTNASPAADFGGNATGGVPNAITIDIANLTQFMSDTSSAQQTTYNGNPPGKLSGINIDTSGKITGRYSNGLTKLLGQIPIALFANPAGLEKIGDNLYVTSPNSGDFNGVGEEVQATGGKMMGGVLEMSNVDLAAEFTEMITTQRGFQANSRIITASDEMLQELVNLRR